jgi:hypothetical protein
VARERGYVGDGREGCRKIWKRPKAKKCGGGVTAKQKMSASLGFMVHFDPGFAYRGLPRGTRLCTRQGYTQLRYCCHGRVIQKVCLEEEMKANSLKTEITTS